MELRGISEVATLTTDVHEYRYGARHNPLSVLSTKGIAGWSTCLAATKRLPILNKRLLLWIGWPKLNRLGIRYEPPNGRTPQCQVYAWLTPKDPAGQKRNQEARSTENDGWRQPHRQ